jgi:glycosyltransferase involved in cell wall biosynthesis
MRILQTPARFYPYAGGVENYVFHLAKELSRLRHQIKVICAKEPKIKSAQIVPGVNVDRLGYIFKIANTNITPVLPLRIYDEEFDILHTHIPTPWSADISAIISSLKDKPLILTYHNDIVGRMISGCLARLYNKTMLRFLLKQSNKIIVSHKKYIDFSPYLRKYAAKIEVIPVGVDINKFRRVENIKREAGNIFFLSVLDEFHRYKGLEQLVLALKIVRKSVPDARLIVGGDGVLKKEYMKLRDSLGLSSQIEFVGPVDNNKLIEYYNRCDCFALPSTSFRQEGFGIVLLEAMACACPVVTTDITGVAQDLILEGAGKVVAPQDVSALASALIEVLKSKPDREAMGLKARSLVERKYSWERVAKQIESLYFDAIGAK